MVISSTGMSAGRLHVSLKQTLILTWRSDGSRAKTMTAIVKKDIQVLYRKNLWAVFIDCFPICCIVCPLDCCHVRFLLCPRAASIIWNKGIFVNYYVVIRDVSSITIFHRLYRKQFEFSKSWYSFDCIKFKGSMRHMQFYFKFHLHTKEGLIRTF